MLTTLGAIFKQVISDPVITVILIVVFGSLALIMLVIYGSKVGADRRSRHWTSVPGRIEQSKIEQRTLRAYDAGSGSRLGGTSPRYVPEVKYSYTVKGIRYEADRIGNGIYVGWTRGFAERWVKRYPAGAQVNVYYDPASPGDAVLEAVSLANTLGLIAAAILFAGVLWFAGSWLFHLAGL